MPARPDVPDALEDPDPADELAHEQRHLAASRAALSRMRTRVRGLSAAGGNAVSTEYLKAALWRRMLALEDDPDVPLFFGRLDTDTHGAGGTPGRERFYIGRRHVTDEDGDPLVLDWRAQLSRAFYRASARDPMGVRLRRRFGFSHGALTAYEDEPLTGDDRAPQGPHHLLEAEIERPRLGPMRDIVATIQPDQDDIVRADIGTTICVQGAPGTGKTAVGLHRAAYLLYAHRDQLSRQGVLVVGPNTSFLRYIGDVLPALGEIDARQTTVEQLCGRVRLRAHDDPVKGRLKGDARMAEVLRRAVWANVRQASEPLVVARGVRRWRVAPYQADEIVAELRARDVRYGAGRALLPQRVAHAVLVKMEQAGESPDDRVQDQVARSRPVRDWCATVWPRLDPVRVVFRLLTEPDLLAGCADGILDGDEQRLLGWPRPPRGPGSARWSLADAVLVDEAADLVDRVPSLGHVVLDEAQDLSPMMLRAVGRRCSTGSATVLGDLAQATTAWASRDWGVALGHLGKPGSHVEELTRGFRVPADVIAYAARLLPVAAPGLAPPTSVRRGGGLVVSATPRPLAAAAAAVVDALTEQGSVGVLVPDARVGPTGEALRAVAVPFELLGADEPAAADPVADRDGDRDADRAFSSRVSLVPATLAKGLEFDHVVLVEPAEIVEAEAEPVIGVRRLYVCLTRAVSSLVIVHAHPLPGPLLSEPQQRTS